MIFLRDLGNIYWHASFYYDFFELAASVDNENLDQQQHGTQDPLIAFWKQQMKARKDGRRRIDGIVAQRARRPLAAYDSSLPETHQSPMQREEVPRHREDPRRSISHNDNTGSEISSTVSANSTGILDGTANPAILSATPRDILPENSMAESFDVTNDDIQFEEWLRASGPFQHIFPSA